MLRADLCDYSDAYIVVKGDITLKKTQGRDFIDVKNRFLAFKSNVMPMYNLLEYSKNHEQTTGSLWNYY